MAEKILYHGIPIVGRMPLFKKEMRQAVRENRKTQTRRIIKLQPELRGDVWHWKNIAWDIAGAQISDDFIIDYCPYGKPGDVRCMCEPLGWCAGRAYYLDDPQGASPVISLTTGEYLQWRWKRDRLPSIYMPTEAARMVCKIVDIRVEELQEITARDVLNEGVDSHVHPTADYYVRAQRDIFAAVWNSINAARGYGWDVPQWVWVISFEKLEV